MPVAINLMLESCDDHEKRIDTPKRARREPIIVSSPHDIRPGQIARFDQRPAGERQVQKYLSFTGDDKDREMISSIKKPQSRIPLLISYPVRQDSPLPQRLDQYFEFEESPAKETAQSLEAKFRSIDPQDLSIRAAGGKAGIQSYSTFAEEDHAIPVYKVPLSAIPEYDDEPL